MGKTAENTDRDVRCAMAVFKAQVLDTRNFDPVTGTYLYEGAITEVAIRKIAGVKSRGTLRANYHETLRRDLRALVLELKIKTGRIIVKNSADADEGASSNSNDFEITRSERLAQTIAALSFRIMVLEREIVNLKSGGGVKADNVTELIRNRRYRE